ncbi:MAG: DUF1156 domain-containing protein [Desulfatibacillaceae bacterium]
MDLAARDIRAETGRDPAPATLAEAGDLHETASAPGLGERYARAATPQSIHVWWARRPHVAMRALVFACLAADTPASREVLGRLCASPVSPPDAVRDAGALIHERYGRPPRVLDMFGGGGTIPFEAAGLGARVTAVDANALSVFVQRTVLEGPLTIGAEQAGRLVRESGARVLARLAASTASLFPLRESPHPPHTYLWTYRHHCGSCGYGYLLSRRPWLSRKGRRRTAVVTEEGPGGHLVRVAENAGGYTPPAVWGRHGSHRCPACGHETAGASIMECVDELVAVAVPGTPRGKVFTAAPESAAPDSRVIAETEARLLGLLKADLPGTELPRWSGVVNPSLYGMSTHADVFNPRQRAVMLALVAALREEADLLGERLPARVAAHVLALLSGLVDQLVDWNCRLSMWIPQNEQVGRAFCGPGVAMLWDYAERDPAPPGPAGLAGKVERIARAAQNMPRFRHRPVVLRADARNLPFADASQDAVVCDPPYYDNLFYGPLADFFYSWKRLLAPVLAPGAFEEPASVGDAELSASRHRAGSSEAAHEAFREGLARTLREAGRVLRDDGVFAMVYAHGAMAGWEVLVQAFRTSALMPAAVFPLALERRQRPRGLAAGATNVCHVFVAKKNRPKAGTGAEDVMRRIEAEALPFAQKLAEAGWRPTDAGAAAFARGVGVLARFDAVSGCPGIRDELRLVEDAIRRAYPEFRVSGRRGFR